MTQLVELCFGPVIKPFACRCEKNDGVVFPLFAAAPHVRLLLTSFSSCQRQNNNVMSVNLEIQGAYAQYQEDAAAFISWLRAVARACGYKQPAKTTLDLASDSESSTPWIQPRRRGGSKKHYSVPIPEYKVSNSEILSMVAAIEKSTSVVAILPDPILNALKRCIEKRVQVSLLYEKTGAEDKGHILFCTLLDACLTRLRSKETASSTDPAGLGSVVADEASTHW